jgi:hypothetical protein
MNAIQNAQVGLGGDISNASTNPAGLGLIRKSEFNFSPALYSTNTDNSQAGSSSTGSGSNFNISQLGYLRAYPVSTTQSGDFRGGAFAITLSRINNFNNYRTYNTDRPYNGINNPNSYIDYTLKYGSQNSNDESRRYTINTPIEQNGTLAENEFEARYAFNRFLLDTTSTLDTATGKRNFVYNTKIPLGNVNQQGRIYDHGYQNQIDMAYGFNLNNKLYLGGGIGIPYLNRTREVLYNETLTSVLNTSAYAQQYVGFSFARREKYAWTGIGFNAKFGAIYNLTKQIRFGISAQTPTWYSMSSQYSFTLDPNFTNAQGQEIQYPTTDASGQLVYVNPYFDNNSQQTTYRIVQNDYTIRTPAQLSMGVSGLDSKLGFVSAQVTLIPYSWARLGSSTYAGDNAELDKRTQLVKQYRLGAEAKLGPIFRLRGGLAWMDNPVKSAQGTFTYSFGGGIRAEEWYLDASVNVYQAKNTYQVFAYSPTINTIANNVKVQISVGSFF